jgi:hypothetical protein
MLARLRRQREATAALLALVAEVLDASPALATPTRDLP